MSIESARFWLGILLVVSNVAVWLGVWLESERFTKKTKVKGERILVLALAVETALAAFILVADTALSTRENAKLEETQRIQGAVIDQLKPRDFSKDQYEGFRGALSGAIKAPRALTIFIAATDEAADFSSAVKGALTDAGVNWANGAFNKRGIPVAALSEDLPNTGLQWYISSDDPDKAKLVLAFAKAGTFVPGFDCSWNPVKVANLSSPALFVLPRMGAFRPRHAWELHPL